MTQTDYDKALVECLHNIYNESSPAVEYEDALKLAFRKGYEYGKRQSTIDHERNLVALGDEYMTAVKKTQGEGISKINGMSIYEAYRQGWSDADSFDEAWTEQHPKDLLDRILDEYPDMIENEVKARMEELQNEQADHFRDDTEKMRMEIAMRAMAAIIPTTSPKNYQIVAQVAVNYADALIKELEKTEKQ